MSAIMLACWIKVIRHPSPKLKVSISESRIFSLSSIHWIARYTSHDRWTEPKLEILTLQVLVTDWTDGPELMWISEKVLEFSLHMMLRAGRWKQ